MVPERCHVLRGLARKQHVSPPQAKETVLGLNERSESLGKCGATAAGPAPRMLVQWIGAINAGPGMTRRAGTPLCILQSRYIVAPGALHTASEGDRPAWGGFRN